MKLLYLIPLLISFSCGLIWDVSSATPQPIEPQLRVHTVSPTRETIDPDREPEPIKDDDKNIEVVATVKTKILDEPDETGKFICYVAEGEIVTLHYTKGKWLFVVLYKAPLDCYGWTKRSDFMK